MIKVEANRRVCNGFGNCVVAAPDVFDIDDDDRVIVLNETVDEADRSTVQDAVRGCPVSALNIADA